MTGNHAAGFQVERYLCSYPPVRRTGRWILFLKLLGGYIIHWPRSIRYVATDVCSRTLKIGRD
jgi:hypothetical protein